MKKLFAAFTHVMLLTALLSMVIALHLPSGNATVVEGAITNDRVWTLANSPYEVVNDVAIASGAKLTIEPGVEVKFNAGTSLIINGSLYTAGSSVNQITFTSNSDEPVAGDWSGIKFYGDENSTLTMSFCVLQFAKNGITIGSLGSAVIERSTIISNSQSGVHTNGVANLLIRDNTIKRNANGISSSGVTSSGLKIINNLISNNENGVYLRVFGDNSRIQNVTISGNTLKDNTNGIYLQSSARPSLQANAYVNDVTISDNLLESNKYGVYILAEGWGASELGGGGVFIYNSVISGNTISLSDYAIYINSTSNWYSWISSIIISGNTIYSSGNGVFLHAFRTPQPPFQEVPFDVTLLSNIFSANGKGVSMFGDVRLNFTCNSVSYNSYGMYLVSSVPSENVARNNDIYKNTAYGIYVVENAIINAEYNYWGASSGPYHETLHPFGEGDRVNGNGENLVFVPFSTEPFGVINYPPFAVLKMDKAMVTVNQTVVFDGSESSDDSAIRKYFFDFGDGATTRGFQGIAKHRYTSPGVYNASLVVTDDSGVNSTNTATQTITVIIPSLIVSVFLNPPSVFSQRQVMVQVNVSDGEADIQEALVQLESDHGGNFEPSSGYTDSNGYFTSNYSTPSISKPINIKITAKASKEGYQDGSKDVYVSVLTIPPSTGIRLDSPWIWFAAIVAVVAVTTVAVVLTLKKKAEAKLQSKTSPSRAH